MSHVAILNKIISHDNDERIELVYGPFVNKESAMDFIDRNDYAMTHMWDIKIIELQEPY